MKLSTGTEIYCSEEVIGINDKLDIYDGYDGAIYDPSWYDEEGERYKTSYTDMELCEIADIAIERWERFKKLHQEAK